jgi:hypothetical protein
VVRLLLHEEGSRLWAAGDAPRAAELDEREQRRDEPHDALPHRGIRESARYPPASAITRRNGGGPAPRLLVVVRLGSERARQAVRQDCSFGRKQESPPAALVVVRCGSLLSSRRRRPHPSGSGNVGVPLGSPTGTRAIACPKLQSSDKTPVGTSAQSAEPQPTPSRRVSQDCRNASRSALIVSASVVGQPCGNPLYVFSVPFCRSSADSGPESA